MTSKAQQIELDNDLVALEKCRVIGKCNMQINPGMKPIALDALALTTCYPVFLITAKVLVIYMHQEILNICRKVPGKEFDEPPTEEEALSFISELGHSGEIRYITDVVVDHLHQPWRTFASIIKHVFSVEKSLVLIRYDSLEFKYFEECTIRRIWTLSL
ncbi:hypothetical protein Tco_1407792 [Tanacetum coccineum]